MAEEEEDRANDGFGADVTEHGDEGDQQQPWNNEFPPPTRNVLLSARPQVFAAFQLLTLVAVAAYAYWNPKPRRLPLQMSCASLDCFNVQAELHSSMDLSAEPCDDFYQYVCGHWAEGHPRYQDQFRYLEAKVYMKANDRVRERFEHLLEPSKPLSTSDKAVLSYVACAEVLRRSIDAPWLIDSLLFMGEDKPGHFLATSGSKNASAEALATLVSLAMDYDLDVLFEVVLAPDSNSQGRSVVSVGHSASLLRWKRHRERYLTAESTARCVRQFVSVMTCDCNRDSSLTAALVAMDAQVTAKMAVSAATSAGRGARLRFRDIPSAYAGVWRRAVRDNLRAAFEGGDEDDGSANEPSPKPSGTRGLRGRQPWNLTGDSVLYASDPRLFSLVDETLTLHPESHVRFYIAFQVVRALAPFASYRLTESLFSDDNATAVYLYVADACTAAASKLTSFALATAVFQHVLSERRVKLAYEQVDALRNETMASLSWLEESEQEAARKRLSSLRSLVAWPEWLNSNDALDAYFAGMPDFRGYYVEVYLDSVKALRKRQKARLLLPRAAGVREDNATGLLAGGPEEGAHIQGFRPSVRYSAWLDSLFISPGTLFEPVLFAADSDNQSVSDAGGDNATASASSVVMALALAGLGHLVAHELWHAALGERTVGSSPEPDITLTGARVRRHACLTDVYRGAAGVAGAGPETRAIASRIASAASENLADVAGLQVAYAAYTASSAVLGAAAAKNETKAGNATEPASWISRVTGFTERELFFIASCFKWCASVADEVVPGSLGFTPARLRCDVPAALTGGFAETFGCSKEHRMSRIAANYSCASPGEPIAPPARMLGSA
ncbi:endothelin-converting enzyme 1-like [Dermacentor albipictus]|uniref:endothelin-converting enzyme 1-like n=1 Tax=Dermacentor albipictus TaxID=60249 RepID=UPI0038FC529D